MLALRRESVHPRCRALPVMLALALLALSGQAQATWVTTSFCDYFWDSVDTLVAQVLSVAFGAELYHVTAVDFGIGGVTQAAYGAWVDDVCEQVWEPGLPPETWITSGPCGTTICPSSVTICFSGSDGSTPVSSLRCYWRLPR